MFQFMIYDLFNRVLGQRIETQKKREKKKKQNIILRNVVNVKFIKAFQIFSNNDFNYSSVCKI